MSEKWAFFSQPGGQARRMAYISIKHNENMFLSLYSSSTRHATVNHKKARKKSLFVFLFDLALIDD
jgi:hypothetical protein